MGGLPRLGKENFNQCWCQNEIFAALQKRNHKRPSCKNVLFTQQMTMTARLCVINKRTGKNQQLMSHLCHDGTRWFNVYRRNNSGGPHSALFEGRILCSRSCLQWNTKISSTKYEMFLKITDCKQLLSGTQWRRLQPDCWRRFTTMWRGNYAMKWAWMVWYHCKNTKANVLIQILWTWQDFPKHILDKTQLGSIRGVILKMSCIGCNWVRWPKLYNPENNMVFGKGFVTWTCYTAEM